MRIHDHVRTGFALKTEFLGLAIMTEIRLVVIDVQRGGPSTGLPTKVEQSELRAAIYRKPGNYPHVVVDGATTTWGASPGCP